MTHIHASNKVQRTLEGFHLSVLMVSAGNITGALHLAGGAAAAGHGVSGGCAHPQRCPLRSAAAQKGVLQPVHTMACGLYVLGA